MTQRSHENRVPTLNKEKFARILGLGTALSLLGDSTLYVALPDPSFAGAVGIGLTGVAILLGINRIARTILNGPIGYLYDKAPRRPLLISSLFLGAISTMFYATTTGFGPFLIGRLLWAGAWSGIWIGCTTSILELAEDENRGHLVSRYQTWYLLGSASSSILGGTFTHLFGFRWGLGVSGTLTLLAAFAWQIWLPKGSSHRERRKTESKPRSLPWKLIITLGVPVFVSRFLFYGVVSSTTILWLSDLVGDQLTVAMITIPVVVLSGLIIASRALVGASIIRAIGRLADRFRHRWILISIASMIGASGLSLMAGQHLVWSLIGTLLTGFVSPMIMVLSPILAGERTHPEQHGRVLGILLIFSDLGSALGPIVALSALNLVTLMLIYQSCAFLLILLTLFTLWHALHEKRANKTSNVVKAKIF